MENVINEVNDIDSSLVLNQGGTISDLVKGRAKASEDFWRNLVLKESLLR